MATHTSILVWNIPWTEEPGGLQSERVWGWSEVVACESQVPIQQLGTLRHVS